MQGRIKSPSYAIVETYPLEAGPRWSAGLEAVHADFYRLINPQEWEDAALHTQSAQQMAHKGGFAAAQIAMPVQVRLPDLVAGGQPGSERSRGALISQQQGCAGQRLRRRGCASYNRRVMFDAAQFVTQIQGWGRELGFSQIGVASVDLALSLIHI